MHTSASAADQPGVTSTAGELGVILIALPMGWALQRSAFTTLAQCLSIELIDDLITMFLSSNLEFPNLMASPCWVS